MKTQILSALVALGLTQMAQALEPAIKPMPAQLEKELALAVAPSSR